MNTKIKTLILALVTLIQITSLPVASAGYLQVRAYGADTVAGYASLLKTSLINPGQNVVFVIEKPDMSVIRVPAQADLEGLAQADLYGHQTKSAGVYKLAVVYPGSSDSSPQNTFTVFPGPASMTQSSISTTEQMISADGKEKTFATVTLYDDYRNPIKNHKVQLISSRKEDEITVLSGGVTDDQGRANFKVTSRFSGVSVLTALDATLNQVLQDREEIIFFAPTKPSTTSGIGGNYLSTNMFSADIGQSTAEVLPGPVHHFDIEGLPSTIKINTDQTLTITARDKDGNVAKNYVGTVLFSVPDDEHAILPNNGEYTFKESDQGKFTFNLALRFTAIGNQTLQVFDKQNWKIAGDRALEVIPEKAVVTPTVSGSLSIKSPMDGASLGNSLVVISGKGNPNINLKIFDNDIKIGDSETDSDGFFSYQAQNLLTGSHVFYVMSESGEVSRSVSVQIDTMPPVLNSFSVDPEGIVAPGTSLSITAQSEPNLQTVKVRLQGVEEMLSPSSSDPGTYTATIAAPAASGSYPIDVILVDSLANKAELLSKSVIQVVVPQATTPPVVKNFEGAPGDGNVALKWNLITNHETPIQSYRIYYGTVLDKPEKIMDTKTPLSTVTIPNLENGKQYFFFIRAVDTKGLESKEPSVTLAITPLSSTQNPPTDNITPPDNNVNSDNTADTHPTDVFVDSAIQVLQGVSDSHAVTLNWQPPSSLRPYFYKIYFGTHAGQYDDYIITQNNSPTVTVSDLITGLPYYFSVVALDLSGREITPLSSEFMLTPGDTNNTHFVANPPTIPNVPDSYNPPLSNNQFSKVPKNNDTGPETIWIVIISLVFSHFLYHHKKKIIGNRTNS